MKLDMIKAFRCSFQLTVNTNLKYIFLTTVLIFSYSTIFSSAGTLDSSFNSGNPVVTDIDTASTDTGNAVVVQPDGKIIVGGTNGTGWFTLVRYNIDGSIDTTFDSDGKVTTDMNGTDIIYALAVQDDGKIVATGTKGTGAFIVGRYDANGSPDNSYDTDGKLEYTVGTAGATAYAMAIQPADGKIVVAGVVDGNEIAVIRINKADGSLDTTFNAGGARGDAPNTAGIFVKAIGTATTIYAMTLQSDGKIVVAGTSDNKVIVARILADGSALDTTFGDLDGGGPAQLGYTLQTLGGATTVAYGVKLQSSGKIVIAGAVDTTTVVARFTTSGALDTTFTNPTGYNKAPVDGGGLTYGGYDTAVAYGLVIQSDDKIVLGGTALKATGTNNDFLIVRYLADGSAWDGTFNTTGYRTIDISGANSVDIGRAIAMQQNGRFVIAGTSADDFALMRVLGDAAPQGCVDVTYSGDGYVTDPAGETSTLMPQVKGLQVQSDNKVYVVTEDLGTTTQSKLVKLNADGSVALAAVAITEIGAADIIDDGKDRVLVVGTSGGNGWIRRYTTSGALTADTAFSTDGLVVEAASTSFSRVGVQSNGRIIVMGQANAGADGILVGYNPNGSLDTTNGFGTAGIYTLASRVFDDMVIGSDNGIYVVYEGAANIEVRKLAVDGSGFFAGYASGAAIDTGLANANYAAARIALDNNGKLVVAAVKTNGDIDFQCYTTAGALDTSSTMLQTDHHLASFVLKQLQCDTNNQIIFAGYDDNNFIVGRLNNVLGLDTTNFAPYSSTPGVLKAAYNDNNPTDFVDGAAGTTPHRVVNAVSIGANGNILFGGYENIDADETVSVVSRVVGDTTPYAQVARYPSSQVGEVDTTFGTNGQLSLASIFGTNGDTPTAMYVYDSGALAGKILVAVASGTSTKLARLNANYTLDTAGFNAAAGFGGSAGIMTLTSFANPTSINIELDGSILVSAGTDGANGSESGKLKSIASDGSAVNWTATSTIDRMVGVLEQTSSRIIAYGQEDGAGTLVAYNPLTGALDTLFGNNGRFNASLGAIVSSAVIDSNNNIVVAYRNGNDVVIKRILPNGYALDSAFTTVNWTVTFSVDTDIRLALDKDGKIVVVVRNDTGHFVAQRYATNGTSDAGPVTITLANPGTSVLSSILALTSAVTDVNGSTLVLGYNTTGNTLVAARLTPAFALDSGFGTSGLYEAAIGTMDTFKAMDITSDEGIIIAGHATDTDKPALTRLNNDYVVTKVDQDASAEVQPGLLDPTFGTAGKVNLNTEILGSPGAPTQLGFSQAKSIVNLADGSYFVAADNGTHTYITKFHGASNQVADKQNTDFGTNGVQTLSNLANVSDMFIDQSGALLVCGGSDVSGSNAGWVKRLNSTTGVVDSTFVVPTDTLDVCTMVRQQTSGRIIVAGKETNLAKLIAYDSITGAIDTSFGTNGYYTLSSNTAAINSMKIDGTDSIYFIANDNSSNATTYKLNKEGASLLWTSATTVANSSVNTNNQLVLDQNGKPVIIAVDTTTPKIVMKRYNASTGAQEATLDITSGTIVSASTAVTSMVVDTNGKLLFTGNKGTTTTFVARVLADMSGLDNAGGDAFNTTGIQDHTISTGNAATWHDLVLTLEGKVDVVGYVNVAGNDTPYIMRLFGDEFVPQFITTVNQGTAGTLETNFGISGSVNLGAVDTYFLNTSAQAVIALTDGKTYVAFNDIVDTISLLARFTQNNVLDTTFQTDGIADDDAPQGVRGMFIDGQGAIVLTGINGSGNGWIKRYLSTGAVDTTFNTTGLVDLGANTVASFAAEQTLQRLIVAGKASNAEGVLRAYKPDGTLDTTFNSLGSTPGQYSTTYPYGIWGMTVDQYDRIVIAYQKDGSDIELARLDSNGVLDLTFSTDGIIPAIITGPNDETQIRTAIDSAGNIIVAARFNDGANKIAIRSFNTTGTSNYAQLNLTTLTDPVLTDLKTTDDGKVLVVGHQSGANDMWVARVTSGGALDNTFGGGDGIMTFNIDGAATARVLNGLSVRLDGRLSLVGYETVAGSKVPFLARAYNEPYKDGVVQSPNSKEIGTRDVTWALNSSDSLSFFAISGADADELQVARAVALQGNNKIYVALDGRSTANTDSRVFVNAFDINGELDTTFSTDGQVEVPHVYKNEYVRDMIVFTQDGISKAILAGYATSGAPLNATNSWLMQYKLISTPDVDATFGGLFRDGSGIASGDIKELHTVGRQSAGRIITGGLNFDGTTGMLLGYTSTGRLDKSFGTEGYYTSPSTAGIYAQAIDSSDRVIIAYNDGSNRVAISRILPNGSGVDTTFASAGGTPGTIAVADRITGISGNTNLRVAIDPNNKIVVAAVNNSGVDYVLKRYNTDGTLDVTLTISAAALGTITAASIARLLIDDNGKAVIVGSVTDAGGLWMIVIRTTATLSGLDTTTFNASDTDGYLKYKVDAAKTTARQATDGVIHNDGRILVVGSEE